MPPSERKAPRVPVIEDVITDVRLEGAPTHGLETGARRSPFSRRPGCQPGDGLVTSSFAAPRSGAIVAGRRIMSLARAALFPGDLRRGRPKKGRRAHA